MRFASRFDWFLLVAGVLISVITGLSTTISLTIYGHIVTVFATAQRDLNTPAGLSLDTFWSALSTYLLTYIAFALVFYCCCYTMAVS